MENKLSQANRMKAIFLEFDSANQFCADCNKDSMDFASINNGNSEISDDAYDEGILIS